MRVDLPDHIAVQFFDIDLPRRLVFDQLVDSGYQIVDWGAYCSTVRKSLDGSSVRDYFIKFGSEEQAVQFKLSFLC